jgi:anaerobic ribonucleoside-triphosphate reductase
MPEVAQPTPFALFRKRDGMTVPFYAEKIENAVYRAAQAAQRDHGIDFDATLPRRVSAAVVEQLDSPLSEYYVEAGDDGQRIPSLEDVQDLVEIVLAEMDQPLVVSVFKRYRKQRDRSREKIKVRERDAKGGNLTDAILLVESNSNSVVQTWDRQRIVKQLIEKTGLDPEEAVSVAKAVENQIIGGDVGFVNTSLIRELVNTELETRGLNKQLEDLSLYRVPRDFIDQLMFAKSDENSNIVSNNPEAVNLGLAEYLLKQWGLNTIFSEEVREAHRTGAIHLHDLGYPHRVYCSSHSIEYIKKYGLRDLSNLNTESNPARSASVLTGHLNTFLASMQANYAGALGIAYINIFYAPYLVGMGDKEIKQVAQELIFNGSQNAFSRGGQTLFLDFNIHTGVPKYLQTVPAIGPGGHYQLRLADGTITELREVLLETTDTAGNRLMELRYDDPKEGERVVLREIVVTPRGGETAVVYDETVAKDLADRGEAIVNYGDYLPEARRFTSALIEVWGDGDRNGRVFEFPKCDFHIGEETFEDPIQTQIFMQACELASKNGSTYFIFDRDEVTLSACCRLRTTIDDNRMLRHPESMRFCGFQNVTINIPQAAYRASRKGEGTMAGLMKEIEWSMDIAVQAHLEKQERIAQMMSSPGCPLWQIGREACDGRQYVELDKATYILGLIGVNDAVKFLYGNEFHESEEALDKGLEVVAHMYVYAKKLAEKYNMKLTLEESPAESAARRLAKADLLNYQKEAAATVKGSQETPDGDAVYYTNSVHLAADAPVCLVERIEKQGMFHALIESGAITHAFVGEERPSPEAIASLMREVFFRTQSAQVTISPEFTYCDACGHQTRGLVEVCPRCQSTKVVGETRVVGYFSKIQNWNKSKRFGELKARQRGIYSVETADDVDGFETADDAESLPKAGD